MKPLTEALDILADIGRAVRKPPASAILAKDSTPTGAARDKPEPQKDNRNVR